MPRSRYSIVAVMAFSLLAWAFGGGPALSRTSRPGNGAPSAAGATGKTRSASPLPRRSVLPAPSRGDGKKSQQEAVAAPPSGAFESQASCAALVLARQRLARPPRSARFASWNLHWFPDGKPGGSGAGGGADLAWLACTLWWLDADVVAVQEVKQTPRAKQALSELLGRLNRLSGARYVARVDDCGSRVPQHVGLLWNEARVAASGLTTVASLNPSGEPCKQQWRPGFAARLRFPGGLDLLTISAHFKSMSDAHSLVLRESSFRAIPGLLREAEASTRDADFLLLGDLNTMGCELCSPPVSAQQELSAAARLLDSAGLRLLPADAPGSHFHDGHATLLDHAVASRAMRELEPSARSHVDGACVAWSRAPSGRAAKKARRLLSDHCPIVIDLTDRDLD